MNKAARVVERTGRKADNAAFRKQEAAMGRPKELTEEEKAELLAKGFKPYVVWLPDLWSDEFWRQIEEDCRLIREADKRENMSDVLDAFASDLWDDLD